MPEDAALKVSVAYDLPKGDPIRNWSPFDFRIGQADGELRPAGKGLRAALSGGKGNILLLKDIEEEFTLAVSGFDRHRDLFVRVDDVSNTPEADV